MSAKKQRTLGGKIITFIIYVWSVFITGSTISVAYTLLRSKKSTDNFNGLLLIITGLVIWLIVYLILLLIRKLFGFKSEKEIDEKQLTKNKKPKNEKLPRGIYKGKIKSNNKIYSVEAELISKSNNLLYILKIISPDNFKGVTINVHPKKLAANWKKIDDENYSDKKRENITKLRELKKLLDQKIIDLNDYESKLEEYKHILIWKLDESILNKEFNANTAKTKIIELQEYLNLKLISKTEYDKYHTFLKKIILN